jgi:hypothetical protein
MLVIEKADCIYRLDVSRFDQMREDPKARPLRKFAGERMRGAEAVVELLRRKPARIVRTTFSILTFDQMGCFDTEAYERHQFGRFAASRPSSLAELPQSTEVRTGVLDARYRFDGSTTVAGDGLHRRSCCARSRMRHWAKLVSDGCNLGVARVGSDTGAKSLPCVLVSDTNQCDPRVQRNVRSTLLVATPMGAAWGYQRHRL